MQHTMKLLIAIGLAGLAAILNWTVVSQRAGSTRFAVLTTDLDPGEPITTDLIDYVEVPNSLADDLRTSLVPWKERAVLSGRAAIRPLKANVMLLWDDFPIRGAGYDLRRGETAVFLDVSNSNVASIAVGEQISFRLAVDDDRTLQWVGPFRVVTVDGKRIPGERQERVRQISVAMPEAERGEDRFAKLQSHIDQQITGDASVLQIRAHLSP